MAKPDSSPPFSSSSITPLPPKASASMTGSLVTPLLLVLGLLAFGVAALSITDVMVARPYDGIVLQKNQPDGKLRVLSTVPGSGAFEAGIKPGDVIQGIGRYRVRDARHAAELINRHRSGDKISYLIQRDGQRLQEVEIRLDRRSVGGGPYFYVCTLGFLFFVIGLFVLVRQPNLLASRVFFVMSCLFLLFLVCRLRPASYWGIDSFLQSIGTFAFLLLAPAFLHFFVLFPRPAWLESLEARKRWPVVLWLLRKGWIWLYVLPEAVFAVRWLINYFRPGAIEWVGGVPLSSWFLFALYLIAGFAALRANTRFVESQRERRGALIVLLGSLFGLAPLAIASFFLTAGEETTTFLLVAVLPLALVPLTFAYAIVRFQFLDIQFILRRSLLYTVTTALVTGLYAVGIALVNVFFAGSSMAAKGLWPFALALGVVLLFDPLRRRIQELLDRSFFAGRSRLQNALTDLGEAMTAQLDLQAVVGDLVDRLPQLLGFQFSALYALRGEELQRLAGPAELPKTIPLFPDLQRHLAKRKGLRRLDRLGALTFRSPETANFVQGLQSVGVESIANLASRRRFIGLALFSGRTSKTPLEDEELDLLSRLLDQAALALETALLLEETAKQAELGRELEIAATIQAQLLPAEVQVSEGWKVAVACRPARVVGGDFYSQLPIGAHCAGPLVFGDVSGKSVSGALMMMAAHEVLFSLSLAMPELAPDRLFELTNRRLCALGKRSFVALGYFETRRDGSLLYQIAGLPAPLLRKADGRVSELPLAEHRLPLGALPHGGYSALEVQLEPGDILIGYSDGVTDASSPSGEFFGEERLFDVVRAPFLRTPDDVLRAVLAAIETFAAGTPLYDDVTLVVVGRDCLGRDTLEKAP